jgi:hypothetical protein
MLAHGCGLGVALLSMAVLADSPAQQVQAECKGAAECRAFAEQAIAQGEFERAHDLAWRAAQQGPRNEPALMHLLARTQALSYRPDDALVMLRRIAEIGVVPDVSSDDFRSARELPGWAAVEAFIESVKNRPPEPLPARQPRVSRQPFRAAAPEASAAARGPSASPRAPSGELRRDPAGEPSSREGGPAALIAPALVESGGSFTSPEFLPGGLACDAVSKRYVFGDRPGRKIRILAEGGDHAIDLTRAVSAGFLDVMALDIDRTDGTLWVASAETDGGNATLHRLQLISGRAIASHRLAEKVVPARPVDLAVTPSAVLLLDAEGRLLTLRRGATVIELLTQIPQGTATSFTMNARNDVAYVAHAAGISRIDLRTRLVSPVRTRIDDVAIAGIEALRHYRSGLIAVQTTEAGTRRLVRLTLDRSGAVVTALSVVDVPLPSGAAPQLTVCGAQLALLAADGGAWTFTKLQLDR